MISFLEVLIGLSGPSGKSSRIGGLSLSSSEDATRVPPAEVAWGPLTGEGHTDDAPVLEAASVMTTVMAFAGCSTWISAPALLSLVAGPVYSGSSALGVGGWVFFICQGGVLAMTGPGGGGGGSGLPCNSAGNAFTGALQGPAGILFASVGLLLFGSAAAGFASTDAAGFAAVALHPERLLVGCSASQLLIMPVISESRGEGIRFAVQ